MSERRDEGPPGPEPSMPEQPQTSVHAQTVGPTPADEEARDANERTLAEETLRRRHSAEQGSETESRRDEPDD